MTERSSACIAHTTEEQSCDWVDGGIPHTPDDGTNHCSPQPPESALRSPRECSTELGSLPASQEAFFQSKIYSLQPLLYLISSRFKHSTCNVNYDGHYLWHGGTGYRPVRLSRVSTPKSTSGLPQPSFSGAIAVSPRHARTSLQQKGRVRGSHHEQRASRPGKTVHSMLSHRF